MRLLLLTINKEKYVPDRLKEEAKRLNHQLDVFQYRDLVFKFGFGKEFCFLPSGFLSQYDNAIFRVAGTSGGEYIAFRDNLISQMISEGKKCLNGESYLAFPRLDKLVQHYCFTKSHLPVVETVCFGRNINLDTFVDQLLGKFSFPIIAKPRFGSQGRGIFLIRNLVSLKKFFLRISHKGGHQDPSLWLFQRFLDTGFDYRLIVLDGRVLGVMKRTAAKGMVVTNFSQGGLISSANLGNIDQELALKVGKLFHLDYAGVDIIKDKKGKSYLLEVNRACQFEGFEQATGINVASEVIKYLADKK